MWLHFTAGAGIAACMVVAMPRPASPQLTAGSDATYATRYTWRGLPMTTRSVIQPSGYAAIPTRGGFVTAGIWANIEPARARPGDVTLTGAGERGIGAVELWLDFASRTRWLEYRAGIVQYWWRNDARVGGVPPGLATRELYVSLEPLYLPLSVKLSAWLDIGDVGGSYYLLDAAYPLPLDPTGLTVGSLYVGGRVGASHGQALDPADPERAHYFRSDGIVHFELYAQCGIHPWKRLPFSFEAVIHHEFARDEAARPRPSGDVGEPRDRFWWFELSASIRSGSR